LECKIHQVTHVKRKLCNKLFQHPEGPVLKEVGTKETGPRTMLANKLGPMTAAADGEAYKVATMASNK
jgi:hypothetical protein